MFVMNLTTAYVKREEFTFNITHQQWQRSPQPPGHLTSPDRASCLHGGIPGTAHSSICSSLAWSWFKVGSYGFRSQKAAFITPI